MCGIAGIWSIRDGLGRATILGMTDAIAHRGPDDSGLEALCGGRLWLGQRRLAIVDLSPSGHQPMVSPDGRHHIVFNGEVYNFAEIRRDLEARGHAFRGRSDTEVVLAAWAEWGIDAVHRFRGMFAFALWDDLERRLHLCRDRFGVKPLYFVRRGNLFAFASELKGLHAAGLTGGEVDSVALSEYLQYGYVTSPRCLFSGVRSVVPGTVVTIDERLAEHERAYWSASGLFDPQADPALQQQLAAMADEDLLDRVEQSLQSAFEYRMVADVPVGLFLSGGIDSSLVAAVLSRRSGFSLKTFTIGYGGTDLDETVYARQVANHLGAEHTEAIVSPSEMLGLVDRLVEISDEPIGDSSLVPTLMVSEVARRSVKVALSADGADELFGGYARYDYCGRHVERLGGALQAVQWVSAECLDRLPRGLVTNLYRAASPSGRRFAAIDDKIRKFVRMSRAPDPFTAYESATSEWVPDEVRAFGVDPDPAREIARRRFAACTAADPRQQFMHSDAARYLPGDLLTKVDRASMSVGLEAREPFLDHETARLAVALPMRWKVRGSENKYVLRRLLDRHFPKGTFDRPKHGFSAPIASWLRGPLAPVVRDELSRDAVRRTGLLDPDAVQRSVRVFVDGRSGASAAGIWFLFQLQRWANRWLRDSARPAASTAVRAGVASAAG